MNRSLGRVVVHFSTGDPSRHFNDLDEAIHFLRGSDWRCMSGRAWIEDPGLSVAGSARLMPGETMMWPTFSPEHSTLVH